MKSLTFCAAKLNCCHKTAAKIIYADTLEGVLKVGKEVPEEKKTVELC